MVAVRVFKTRIQSGLRPGEIIVDHFAGGGGASTGVGLAAGRSPDIAINHNRRAIRMHARNHPETTHHVSDIWEVDPVEVCGGRPVGLLWTSPTCTHFSKAKGSPLSAESIKLRALAWVTCRWARAVWPRIICLENVEEFAKWGPLHRQHSDWCRGARCVRGCMHGVKTKCRRRGVGKRIPRHTPGCPGRACAKGCQIHQPIKARQGETFRAFVARLEKLGYVVEWRVLYACDYGAPTRRRRLVLVARRDGLPISWPCPTHGPERPHPYRTAAECIDWSDLGESIFDENGNTRHVDKTLQRLARGVQRFVIERRPFLVPLAYGSKSANEDRMVGVDGPVPTICGSRGAHALVAPVVAPAAAAPYLIHRSNGERPGQAPRVYDVARPLGTIVAGANKHAVAAALVIKHNGGNNDRHGSPGQSLDRPLDTISTRDTKALAGVHLIHYDGAPRSAAAFLVRYNGQSGPQGVDQPLGTLDTTDRYAAASAEISGSARSVLADPGRAHLVYELLVRYGYVGPALDHVNRVVVLDFDGESRVIADICMRMLKPPELFLAQGFPRGYDIEAAGDDEPPLTKTDQIMMCGNSVPPQLAEAVVRAQLWGVATAPRRVAA